MEIHHTGIVVREISTFYKHHLFQFFPENMLGPVIHDPLQKVNAVFIETAKGRIEILEPAAEDSPISEIARKAPAGYHHICLEVEDLDQQLERCRSARQVIVSPPKPAVAFGGRRISFVMGQDRLLWELLESL